MLLELRVRDLGVIADLGLVLGPGMTALTGETGAGKTLVVEAIELLLGERPDAALVRPGAAEATVEGRFLLDGEEVVLGRAVPTAGRSRAYIGGRFASATELAEAGRRMVDLHGQHAHQSLLGPRVQRQALDRFGAVDVGPWTAARQRLAAVDAALAALGGDERLRAREADLLRYQLTEIEGGAIDDPNEEDRLEAEEDRLADAAAHRESAFAAYDVLVGDGGAGDGLGAAATALAGRRPFAEAEARLRALAAEVADAAADLRHQAESVVVDPERLEEVRARCRLLADLRRKYGERLSDVLDFETQARARLAELEQHGERARALDAARVEAGRALADAAARLARARREAAPRLAAAVADRLQNLAMAGSRFEVAVGGPDPADEVTFLLGANRGEAVLPLAKVASGGELARAMLAVRLVVGPAPPTTGAGDDAGDADTAGTLVFDEVDAGIGGQAALAVGRALADLAAERQVLVVTHLPQVAAFADHQVAVSKREWGGRTVAEARTLGEGERVVELSRMLSGQPESASGREHAQELLAMAARAKASPAGAPRG